MQRSGGQGAAAARTRAWRLHRAVVLVGMMGSGKSAVGRTLAARLGQPLVDSDAAIEEAANASIAEIFARDGETFFRDREHAVIRRLLSGRPCILSTGGGAFMSPRNRALISEKGVSVWLNADLDTLWERVRHKNTRPLLRTPDPKGRLAELFETRGPVYALADLTVRSELGYSLEQTTDRVVTALLTRPDVLTEAQR